MGLFNFNTNKKLPAVSDIFSAQDLQTIGEVIGQKRDSYYWQYRGLADTILQVVKTPDKTFTKREWRGIIYSAGCMTKLEPELAPMLKAIIERYHAFNKKQ